LAAPGGRLILPDYNRITFAQIPSTIALTRPFVIPTLTAITIIVSVRPYQYMGRDNRGGGYLEVPNAGISAFLRKMAL